MNPKPQTCPDRGADHTWSRCGETSENGALLFRCSTCTAWGWAPRLAPSRVTPYRDPFRARRSKTEPPVTARPREPLEVDHSGWVDRRGDRLPSKRKKDVYTPRFGLSDWDEAEWGPRVSGATAAEWPRNAED